MAGLLLRQSGCFLPLGGNLGQDTVYAATWGKRNGSGSHWPRGLQHGCDRLPVLTSMCHNHSAHDPSPWDCGSRPATRGLCTRTRMWPGHSGRHMMKASWYEVVKGAEPARSACPRFS